MYNSVMVHSLSDLLLLRKVYHEKVQKPPKSSLSEAPLVNSKRALRLIKGEGLSCDILSNLGGVRPLWKSRPDGRLFPSIETICRILVGSDPVGWL